jgi:hypothetical protein
MRLHASRRRGGGKVGVGELGVEGDRQVQARRGAVDDRVGEVGRDRSDTAQATGTFHYTFFRAVAVNPPSGVATTGR